MAGSQKLSSKCLCSVAKPLYLCGSERLEKCDESLTVLSGKIQPEDMALYGKSLSSVGPEAGGNVVTSHAVRVEKAATFRRSARRRAGDYAGARQSHPEIFAKVVLNLLMGSALRYKTLTARVPPKRNRPDRLPDSLFFI
jgi:hypothetical protein